jgi:hypothetical protein
MTVQTAKDAKLAAASAVLYKGFDEIENYVQELLVNLGEQSTKPIQREKVEQTTPRILSSRNELPHNVRNIATELQNAPFMTVVGNSLANAGSSVTSLVSTLLFPLKYAHAQISQNTQQQEKEELQFILSQLKYEKYLTPKQQIEIYDAFVGQKFDGIERHVMQLLGSLIDTKDRRAIITLLNSKQYVTVFRYLHTLVLFHKLDTEQSSWKDFANSDKKNELIAAHKLLQEKGISDEFNSLLTSIFCQVHVHNWLKNHLESNVRNLPADLQPHIDLAFAALKENNAADFKKACLFVLESLSSQKTGLERAYLEDMADFMKKTDSTNSKFFSLLATQLQHECYLSTWDEKATSLLALLEREDLSEQYLEHEEDIKRLDELAGQMLKLYGHFGKILESETRAPIARSLYAAQYGKAVTTFRRINEQFIHHVPHDKISPEKAHFLCSCLYGRHVHLKKPELKWEALPEKLTGISKIEEIPHDLSRKEVKSILFLNCTMGGSHVSATDAIIKYTKKNGAENPYRYHVRALNVPLDVLLPLDPVHNVLGKFLPYANIDWCFNTLMTMDRCEGIAALRWVSKLTEPSQESKRLEKELMRAAILKEKPDLLVMTYDWHATPICEVAEELGIPVLRVELDYDAKGYEGVKIPRHFKVATLSNHPKTLATIDGDIRKDQVEALGPPLRPEFLEEYTPERILEIRRKRGIADDEKIVFMSNGALGMWSKVPEIVASWSNPGCKIRLIVVCGRNQEFEEHLKAKIIPDIVNKDLVKIDTQGFTEARGMAELMNIAHMFIGKPGSVIAAEALHSKTRFLSDETGYRLDWEKTTTDVIVGLKAGDRMTNLNQLKDKIKEQLNEPKLQVQVFPTDAPYSTKYARTLAQLIKQAEQDDVTMSTRAKWQSMPNPRKLLV